MNIKNGKILHHMQKLLKNPFTGDDMVNNYTRGYLQCFQSSAAHICGNIKHIVLIYGFFR